MINFEIPQDIEQEARAYMESVLQILQGNGVVEDVDNAALTMLARNYSMFITASKQLQEEGLTITSDRGNVVPHPAIKIARDAQIQAMKVMTEFGLTAKSRSKLPIKADGDNSPFEQFINEAREDNND